MLGLDIFRRNRPVYDVHTHTLPGVDDGSKTIGRTNKMLKSELKAGVTHVIATPHFQGWRYTIDDFLSRREAGIEQVVEYYNSRPDSTHPALLVGAEVSYYEGLPREPFLDKLTIRGTNVLLLELPWWKQLTESYIDEAIELQNMGYQIVLAHIERYLDNENIVERFERMRAAGMHAHINSNSLQNHPKRDELIGFYRSGIADLIGTDAHNMVKRPPDMAEGRAIIKEYIGRRKLAEIDRLGEQLYSDAEKILELHRG